MKAIAPVANAATRLPGRVTGLAKETVRVKETVHAKETVRVKETVHARAGRRRAVKGGKAAGVSTSALVRPAGAVVSPASVALVVLARVALGGLGQVPIPRKGAAGPRAKRATAIDPAEAKASGRPAIVTAVGANRRAKVIVPAAKTGRVVKTKPRPSIQSESYTRSRWRLPRLLSFFCGG